MAAGDNREYEIYRIVSQNKTRDRAAYQFKWRGYDAIDDSWLREEGLANASELL